VCETSENRELAGNSAPFAPSGTCEFVLTNCPVGCVGALSVGCTANDGATAGADTCLTSTWVVLGAVGKFGWYAVVAVVAEEVTDAIGLCLASDCGD
jgi:hypothetical protein